MKETLGGGGGASLMEAVVVSPFSLVRNQQPTGAVTANTATLVLSPPGQPETTEVPLALGRCHCHKEWCQILLQSLRQSNQCVSLWYNSLQTSCLLTVMSGVYVSSWSVTWPSWTESTPLHSYCITYDADRKFTPESVPLLFARWSLYQYLHLLASVVYWVWHGKKSEEPSLGTYLLSFHSITFCPRHFG